MPVALPQTTAASFAAAKGRLAISDATVALMFALIPLVALALAGLVFGSEALVAIGTMQP